MNRRKSLPRAHRAAELRCSSNARSVAGPWAKTEGGLRIVYCILNIDWGKMS